MASRSLLPLEDDFRQPWHIDPRDRDPRPEEKRQLAFLRNARMICPAVNIFAVPNAGKRTQWAANKAKREGMKAGALDIVCTWKGGVAFLEFKNGQDWPSDNQVDQLNLLFRQGHHCGVFRQERTALEFLEQCGAPFIGRIKA